MNPPPQPVCWIVAGPNGAGKTTFALDYLPRVVGCRVELIYLALPSVEMAKFRVAERVRHGGHNIPRADIERRYFRSLDNFLGEYALLVDRAVCYCNADRDPVIVFKQHGAQREVTEPARLQALEEMMRHD